MRCLLALVLSSALHAAPASEPAAQPPPAPTTVPRSPSHVPRPPSPAESGPELNIRELGAMGDGQPHPVSEWIAAKKYKSLRDLQRDYRFVTSLEWSADEAAFQRALHDLPPTGGTIRIPAGKYLATAYGWRIERDHVRLVGAGFRDTTLTSGPKLSEGLTLAPYRHTGWLQGIAKEYPFAPDSGATGSDRLRLREPARVADFQPGEIVYIRNGACRFDQDYGEFNEIADATPEGDLVFKHPLSRDYTRAAFNWANETAEPLVLPKPGRTVIIRVRTGDGFFDLPSHGSIAVGEAFLEIVRREGETVAFRNPIRPVPRLEGAAPSAPLSDSGSNGASASEYSPPLGFNPPAGTILPAGTKIGQSRSIIKVTRTTRAFHAEGLRVFGRRKALNLSNTYESTFLDCDFVRSPEATTAGGLTVDADGGRFAEFNRCTIRGTVPCGMQFARSFGNATFTDCTFANTNVVFSEFAFRCTLQHSSLAVPSSLGRAVIVGRSCGDLRIEDNRIVVSGGGPITVFDAPCDIQSHKHDAPGRLVLRNNRIVAPGKPLLFLLRPDRPSDISGNTLNGEPVDPPTPKPTP